MSDGTKQQCPRCNSTEKESRRCARCNDTSSECVCADEFLQCTDPWHEQDILHTLELKQPSTVRPADPIYWDDHEERNIRESIAAAQSQPSPAVAPSIDDEWEAFRMARWPDRPKEWSDHWKSIAITFAESLTAPLREQLAKCEDDFRKMEKNCNDHIMRAEAAEEERNEQIEIASDCGKNALREVRRAEAAERELKQAQGYLSRLFTRLAPKCTQDGSLITLCTQIDNYIAGSERELKELREAASKVANWTPASDEPYNGVLWKLRAALRGKEGE